MAGQTTRSVLMVDDDKEDAFLVKRALKRANSDLSFDHLCNGESFIKQIIEQGGNTREMASVILLDINMPRMNGFEVLEALDAYGDWKQSTLVMLTTSESEEDRARALGLGADRFVTKPSSQESLNDFAQTIAQM